MTSLHLPSFQELLRKVPGNKRYLLDSKVQKDRHLVEIAQKLTRWKGVLPYLLDSDTEEATEAIDADFRTTEEKRLALLQKWREKYGSNATYRNLAQSFYNAGKPDLVETVYAVMTCDYPVNTSQQISLSHAMPNPTGPMFSARISSLACKYLLLCFIIVLSSMLLATYFFEADNSQSGKHFSSSFVSTEVERFRYGHKTSEFAPNDLPHLPGPFIGRDKEVENISHLLHFTKHFNTKMVHIFGLPAVGKSTLAIHVGYQMARYGVTVRYVNVDETHIFKIRKDIVTENSDCKDVVTENSDQRTTNALSKSFSNIEIFWYSHTKKEYVSTSSLGLIQWAKGLSNDTVLIMDNCDPLLQSNATWKPFVEMFVDLNKASHFLRIVTTSRLKVSLVDGFKLYKLKPLDSESAIQLLQSVSDAMTLNDSRTVNGLVGGIPLALKIVGSLVSEIHPPDFIITELKQNLIETLTPEDVRPETEKIRPVLELSYKYLDTSTQECALYLSHFPGSFSHEDALHTLSNCTNSGPAKCLTNLTDRSLLNPYSYAGQHRYQLHKLIKEYLKDVESHKPGIETSRIAIRFNSSFLTHYTLRLSGFVSRYSEVPHDDENIGGFDYESHNFEYLLENVHYFHRWPLIPFVNLTHSLTCQLMLETFTKMELLKVGQRSLVLLEERMDDISAEIGASETLNLYRDLVLQLRKWILSYPGNCWALCNETFLPNISSRYQTIDKQLATSNYDKRGYYDQLKFPYYQSLHESICYTNCVQFKDVDISVVEISLVAVLLLIAIGVIFKKQFNKRKVLHFLVFTFWYCGRLFIKLAFIVSISVVIYVNVSLNPSAFPLPKIRSDRRTLKLLLYVVLYAIATGALTVTIIRDPIMIDFLFICIALAEIITLISPRVVFSMYPIFILAFVIDAYLLDHYVSSFLLAFLYPYWEYFDIILRLPILLCVRLYLF